MFSSPKNKFFPNFFFVSPPGYTSPPLCPLEAIIYVAPLFKGGKGVGGEGRGQGSPNFGKFNRYIEKKAVWIQIKIHC
jgi:hypothetical protein